MKFPERILVHFALTDQRKLEHYHQQFLVELNGVRAEFWNAALPNLAKHEIQNWNRRLTLPDTQALPEGADADLLIIKTRLNAFGEAEALLSQGERVRLGLPPSCINPLEKLNRYPVMSRDTVPRKWWLSKSLFIERFIGNKEGMFARIFFVGNRVVIYSACSRRMIKRVNCASQGTQMLLKRNDVNSPTILGLLPQKLRLAFVNSIMFANAIRLDYGAIDLVFSESTPYIVDINPTPQGGPHLDVATRSHLSNGIRDQKDYAG